MRQGSRKRAPVVVGVALLVVASVSVLVAALGAGPQPPTALEPSAVSREASAPSPPDGLGAAPTATPTPVTSPPPTPNGPAPAEEPGALTALAAVDLLTVKGRAPRTGYDRDLFGQGWVDVDRNGCDTRNDVLARDLTAVVLKPGTRDCVVLSGTLADPYSGTVIAFQRGNATSTAVQIDHVVALSDAWQKGAQQWDEATRTLFANTPLNLLAVDGGLNQQKGDGDTATWLPPNKGFRCTYVARQVGVKHAFGLWVTAAERDAMVRVLSECPDEPLPAGDGALVVGAPPTAPPASPAPAPGPPSAPDPAGPPLTDPGNAVDCGDFATWPEAQAWFDLYHPAFGDVAHLDGDATASPARRCPAADAAVSPRQVAPVPGQLGPRADGGDPAVLQDDHPVRPRQG